MKSLTKLTFPRWTSLIHEFSTEHAKAGKDFSDIRAFTDSIYSKMIICREHAKSNPPLIALSALNEAQGNYSNGFTIEDLSDKLKRLDSGMNTFYAVYDTQEKSFNYVDPTIEQKIGIKKEDFNMMALLGLDPTNPLHHPEDVDHLIRWAAVAYTILSLPGFSFSANRDYYEVRFRLNVSRSSIPEIREMGYMTMCKRAFLIYSKEHGYSDMKPRFHLNEYTMLDEAHFDYVQPAFVSSPIQAQNLNALAYLINANLIGIPTKHILLLHEKLNNDRNKQIANEFNRKLLDLANIEYAKDEHQVGDSFTKLIRPKLTETMGIWDKTFDGKPIVSDQQCVHYARKLGLIPIPKKVSTLIYRSIIETDRTPLVKNKISFKEFEKSELSRP